MAVTTKKNTRKKSNSTKKLSAYKQSLHEKKLVKELNSLCLQMDAEGLTFLIEQAKVHLYNMEVIAIQEQMNELQQKKVAVKNSVLAHQLKKEFTIQKSTDGDVYHIMYDGKSKILNSEELFCVLKIVNAPVAPDEIRLNLLHWFFKERADFVGDFGLRDTHDDRWLSLIALFKKNFKLNIR